MGYRLGHLNPSTDIEIIVVIACRVIAHIVCHTCLAAKHRSLLLCFDALSPTRNAASRHSSCEEWPIIRTTVKLDRGKVQTSVLGKISLELVLSLS